MPLFDFTPLNENWELNLTDSNFFKFLTFFDHDIKGLEYHDLKRASKKSKKNWAFAVFFNWVSVHSSALYTSTRGMCGALEPYELLR